MKELSLDHWERANDALASARALLEVSPDGAASRAYYCAFHAASSYFAADARVFKKHSALEAAVHRELVRTGLVTDQIGKCYAQLVKVREVGDYGDLSHVTAEAAVEAVVAAEVVLRAIRAVHPLAEELRNGRGA